MNDGIKVSIIKLKNRPHYQCRWIDPITGKEKHKTSGESNEKKALKFAAKLEEKLNSGTWSPTASVTWEEFRIRLTQEHLPSLAISTQRKYEQVLNGFEKLISVKSLADIGAAQMTRYQSHLRKKGLSEQTIKGNLAYIRAALKWAVTQDMIREVPKINLPKRAKASKVMKGRPITGEEYDRMLAVVPAVVGDEHAASITTFLNAMWWGGLRLGEALSLTWTTGGFCLVKMNGHYYFRIQSDSEKGNTDRFMPVAPQFEMMLPSEPINCGRVFRPQFSGMQSDTPRLDTLSKKICDIGETAGVITDVVTKLDKKGKPIEKTVYGSAHDLRRAFGTRWAPLVQPKLLMEMMRHKNIETTMKYYVMGNAEQTSKTLWNVVNSGTAGDFGNISGNIAPIHPQGKQDTTPRTPK